MATHGRSGIRRWALGGVVDKVLRVTRRPVALIKTGGTLPGGHEKGILKKVLVSLDGSGESEVVIPCVEGFATKLGTEVLLLYVIGLDSRADTGRGYDNIISAERYLEEISARLKQQGMSVKYEVKSGSAAEEIIKCANETHSDMIAISTHGRSGMRRWAFGSVADRVLREGNTAILLVRAAGTVTD